MIRAITQVTARSLPLCALLAGCTIIPEGDPSRLHSASHQNQQTPATPYQPPQNPPSPTYQSEIPPVAQPSHNAPNTPLTYAALGETVTVDGPRITPLDILEDSRCPMNARCVWSGHLRLRVKIESGNGGVIEVTSGKPVHIADGTLELVEIQPDKMAGQMTGNSQGGSISPSQYRFGFRFMGGY